MRDVHCAYAVSTLKNVCLVWNSIWKIAAPLVFECTYKLLYLQLHSCIVQDLRHCWLGLLVVRFRDVTAMLLTDLFAGGCNIRKESPAFIKMAASTQTQCRTSQQWEKISCKGTTILPPCLFMGTASTV